MHDLQYILAPISKEDFFREYYERKHLIVARNNSSYYQDLASIKDIDAVISSNELRFPEVQLVKDSAQIAPRHYTLDSEQRGNNLQDYISKDSLLNAYRSGCTIVLDFQHLRLPKLQSLSDSCFLDFSSPVQANVYITPEGSTALNPHYDTHSTFILQISGRKLWKLYESKFEAPLASQPFQCTDEALTQTDEIILEAGDLLYMPRGLIHAAQSTDEDHSIHITLGVRATTWQEVLEYLAALGRESPKLRQHIRPNLIQNPITKAELSELLSLFNNYLATRSNLTDVVNSQMRDRLDFYKSHDDSGRFSSVLSLPKLSTETILTIRPGIFVSFSDASDHTEFKFSGKCIKVRLDFSSSVKHALTLKEFRVSDLENTDPSITSVFSELVAQGLFNVKET